MVSEEFSAIAGRRGCVGESGNFCGTYEGLPFAATFFRGTQAGNTVFNMRFLFEQRVPGAMYRTIKKQLKGTAKLTPGYASSGAVTTGVLVGGALGGALAAGAASGTGGVPSSPYLYSVTVRVKENHQVDPAFDQLVAAVLTEVRARQLTPPYLCPVCKQPGVDAYAYQGGAYRPVHTACVRQQAQAAVAKMLHNQRHGNYAFGILGALLGATVGAVPTVLLLALGHIIVALLCALIPLGALLGYKLLGGKIGKAAGFIVVIASLLLIPVMDYAVESINFLRIYNEIPPIALYIELFLEDPSKFLPDYLTYLLFVGLGILIALGNIARSSKSNITDAAFQESSLRPINPAPYASAGAPPLPAMPAAHTLPPEMRDAAPVPTAEPPVGPDMR